MAKRKVEFLKDIDEYVYDERELINEIKDLNEELADPPTSAKGICSFTKKHAYPVIEDKLQELKQKGKLFRINCNPR